MRDGDSGLVPERVLCRVGTSLERLVTLTWEEIDQRYRAFIELTDSQYTRWNSR